MSSILIAEGIAMGEPLARSRLALRCGEICQGEGQWKRAIRYYKKSIAVDDANRPSNYSKLAHDKIGPCLDAVTLERGKYS